MNTQNSDKATARPWKAILGQRHWMIEAVKDTQRLSRVFIAEVYETSTTVSESEHAELDAALIVRAVNEYEALSAAVEAAKELHKACESVCHDRRSEKYEMHQDKLRTVLANLAAIRKGSQ